MACLHNQYEWQIDCMEWARGIAMEFPVFNLMFCILIVFFLLLARNLAKEPWVVCGMMDYFIQVRSARIVDVLVKAPEPHYNHIFDRLLEWTNSSKRNHAFELFWHIVKRHPSWLCKVDSHQFFREILKLLKVI